METSLITCATCRTKTEVPHVADAAPRCAQCNEFLPWIVSADDSTFAAIADSSAVPVCVNLWARWAPPSRMVSPLLERVAIERAGRIKLVHVNVEDARRTQTKWDARLIPTLLLLWQGKEVERHQGAMELPALRRWIDRGVGRTLDSAPIG